MASYHKPPDHDGQQTFGFVREHERRLRFGGRGRVRAHWRRLPGPQPHRHEARQDEGPRLAPAVTLSVTVTVSVYP
ncbi:MAG TPA: hypothetical protein VJ779_07035 [Acetobacteraceae bacterium]|nr:hypothetical protein [Acetobacteraceae bacterium]